MASFTVTLIRQANRYALIFRHQYDAVSFADSFTNSHFYASKPYKNVFNKHLWVKITWHAVVKWQTHRFANLARISFHFDKLMWASKHAASCV